MRPGQLHPVKRSNVLRRFGELAERLRAELSVRDAFLDGEVVALNGEGRMDFRGLLAGRGWLHDWIGWRSEIRRRTRPSEEPQSRHSASETQCSWPAGRSGPRGVLLRHQVINVGFRSGRPCPTCSRPSH
jgi:hypothetical protein